MQAADYATSIQSTLLPDVPCVSLHSQQLGQVLQELWAAVQRGQTNLH